MCRCGRHCTSWWAVISKLLTCTKRRTSSIRSRWGEKKRKRKQPCRSIKRNIRRLRRKTTSTFSKRFRQAIQVIVARWSQLLIRSRNNSSWLSLTWTSRHRKTVKTKLRAVNSSNRLTKSRLPMKWCLLRPWLTFRQPTYSTSWLIKLQMPRRILRLANMASCSE